MEKRRGAPLKNQKLTVRESSILQHKGDSRLLPRNPYLLQCVVQTLLRRIAQLDKTKSKNTATEARAYLWLMARHEDRLLAPSFELFMHEPVPEEFLRAMGSSSDFEQEIEIGQFLLGKPTIQRQLRGLKGGRGRHEHLPESLTIQRKIVIDYFEKHPLPGYQKTFDKAANLMQAWVDEHLPILMPRLKDIPCRCGYYGSRPIELPEPHSVGHAGDQKTTPAKVLYRYSEKEALLLFLCHLHQFQHRQSKLSQIDKLLKLSRSLS